MSQAPTGTVTFLFTDIEGSTRLWEQHPAAMDEALARHDDILRRVTADRKGFLLKSTGDGVVAVFSDVNAAADAARAAQRELAGQTWGELGSLRARMGIHTGVAAERDGDYFGPTLNRTARLMAIGHGGQVLVSNAAHALLDDRKVRDLGEHRLRDLSQPERVFQLLPDGADLEFPPLRSLELVPTNLPEQLTSFVGRRVEVAELVHLLGDHRLVTVTGVGGVGKTRLAMQVGAELLPDFADGVFLVELAPAHDEESLFEIVASSLGVPSSMTTPEPKPIADFLRGKAALVVLDNCEHVLDGAATLVEELVQRCPRVRILATSREVLAVPGEHVLGLRSLGTGAEADPASVAASDAVTLFAERATSIRPDFRIDSDNLGAVAEICRRLDGIPLAVELAAARVIALQPRELASMLDERFRLLTGSRRSRLERHHTLRAAVDWSYSLLSDAEQRVFDRLAVFAGSFDVEAAVAVASDEGLAKWDVIDAITNLVAKSMLSLEAGGAGTRYQQLETLRQYGVERLQERDELDETRRRHARHYADMVAVLGPRLVGRDEIAARNRILDDVDNLRAAVTWTLDAPDHADADLGLHIIAGVALLVTAARRAQVGAWAERAVPRLAATDHATRFAVLGAAGFGALVQGRNDEAFAYAEAAMADGYPDECPAAVLVPGALAVSRTSVGSFQEGIDHLVAGARALREQGDVYGDVTLSVIAVIYWALVGDVATAQRESDLALARARDLACPTALVTSLYADGLAYMDSDETRALASYETCLDLTAHGASDIVYAEVQEQVAHLRFRAGDAVGAVEAMRAGLVHTDGVANYQSAVSQLWYSVEVLCAIDAYEVAAVVAGATDRSPDMAKLRTPITGPAGQRHDAALESCAAALGAERHAECLARGEAMTYDEAIVYALAQLDALLVGLNEPT